MQKLLPQLGLLDADTIRKVLDGYTLIEQYLDRFILLAGAVLRDMPDGRRVVCLDAKHSKVVALGNRTRAIALKEAMDALAPYLG